MDEGANVSLACEAEGAPLLFNWTCNGQNMNVSASVLNISHVVTNGSCMCMIHNHLGDASKVIRLHVVTPQRPSMPLAVATPEPAAADTGTAVAPALNFDLWKYFIFVLGTSFTVKTYVWFSLV